MIPRRRPADRALGILLLALLSVGGLAMAAHAASWGGLVPGESQRRDVEARFGPPTRERLLVEEGRSVAEWTYIGERAPRGMDRMVVSFGFLRPAGFSPDVVRAVSLYPKPRVFTVEAIAAGWGKPDGIGTDEQTGRPVFRYAAQGLLIFLDRQGGWAEIMIFGSEPGAAKP